MIVKVKQLKEIRYITVESLYINVACHAAFVFVHQRKPEDYNELHHNTLVISVEKVAHETANALAGIR